MIEGKGSRPEKNTNLQRSGEIGQMKSGLPRHVH